MDSKELRLTGVFDQGQENKLGSMGKERDKENHVRGHHQRDAVVTRVSDRVHRMRRHLKDSVKGEGLLDQEEEIAPVWRESKGV